MRGQLLRDFAALNKVETVPFLVRLGKGLSWHPWRLVCVDEAEISPADYRLLDTIAEYSTDPDRYFDEIRTLYESTEDLRPPEAFLSR